MKEDAQFFVGQKALISKGGEVLVLSSAQKGLDFPGGKIQEDEEDLMESLKREVREETGLEIEVGEPFATWTKILPAEHKFAGKKIYFVAYRCKYISGDIKLSDEHNQFRWVTKENYHETDDGTPFFQILKKYFE